jgi:hypothetical protein
MTISPVMDPLKPKMLNRLLQNRASRPLVVIACLWQITFTLCIRLPIRLDRASGFNVNLPLM